MSIHLSKYERSKEINIPFIERHTLFVKESLDNIYNGIEPSKAVLDVEASHGFFNEKEQEKMSLFSSVEQLLNKELTIDTRHEMAWSGYVLTFGQVSAHRFFRRPTEGNGPLGIGRLKFHYLDSNELIINKNGLVGTRIELAKKARLDYLKAGASLQSAGVIVGAPVYGVLRLMGRSHENALGWAQVATTATDIVTGLAGRNSRVQASRGSNSRPSFGNNIRFTNNVKRGVVTFPTPKIKSSKSSTPKNGFLVPPPPGLKNAKPFLFKHK